MKEYNEMFENLEEGILVADKDSVRFSNRIFNNIMKGLNLISDIEDKLNEDVMNKKIFKLYRSGD